MYSDINEKLDSLRQGIARLKKIDAMITQLKTELCSLRRKEGELKEVLEKESLDVDKLENKTLASVFYSIIGRLDEHVGKERGEMLAAKLKYDQTVKDISDAERELSELSAERYGYTGFQMEYDSLFAKKKELLLSDSGEAAQRISKLTEEISQSKIKLKEIREALSAGRNARSSLDGVLESLNSAENWGTWDLLGGGLISDLAKHSHIDDANAQAKTAQSLLRRLNTELSDVRIDSDISIDINGFSKFADFFFDGLIADWCMQKKIEESHNNVTWVYNQVTSVIKKLEKMEASITDNITELEAELSTLITSA